MDGLTGVIDSFKTLATIIADDAPMLATALGSPLGGIVCEIIGHAFGVVSPTQNAVVDALKQAPDASDKLRILENQHKDSLNKLLASNYALQVKDVEDAREKASQYKTFVTRMAYLVTVGFFGVLIFMFLPISVNPNSTERELLSMLVGMLVSKWQTIIDFFYGSSSKQGGLQ